MVLINVKEFRDMLYTHFEFLKVDETEVWCVVDVEEVLDHIPEIEAIPIEWVKRWAMKSENTYNREQIVEMLNDWEKENG